jgi:6-phosphogluconolactonase
LDYLTFIGTQVRASGSTPSLFSYRFDEATGLLSPLDAKGGIDNPTWVAVDAPRHRLYAASEVGEWNEGTVSAYDFDPATGRLSYVNKQPTLGSTTCHLGVSPDGRFMACANYAVLSPDERPDQSTALYALGRGELAPPIGRARQTGSGPNARRQERSHGHCALFSPDSRWLWIADLGLDRLCAYAVGAEGLTPTPALDVVFETGRGPRHAAFHPDGETIFVVHELRAGVSTCRFDGRRVEVVETVDMVYPQPVDPAAIQVSPDGRHVYASVRSSGEIVGFAVAEDRRLNEIGRWPAGGRTPRDARLTASGRHLLVANQDAGSVAVFARDAASGGLTFVNDALRLERPMCVAFLAA